MDKDKVVNLELTLGELLALSILLGTFKRQFGIDHEIAGEQVTINEKVAKTLALATAPAPETSEESV